MSTSQSDTAPVTFSLVQLWLLQRYIRHEMQGQDTWHFAPANAQLNDQIAEAILFCEENKETGTTLLLSMGDCYAIDYCVPQDAKDVNGHPVGKDILRETFKARKLIKYGYPEAPDPGLTRAQVVAKLSSMSEDGNEQQ